METANPKLGRQDWVQAALETFIEKGMEAVKSGDPASRANRCYTESTTITFV
jgi:DNA-binding transcriptional regulator YbjK